MNLTNIKETNKCEGYSQMTSLTCYNRYDDVCIKWNIHLFLPQYPYPGVIVNCND